MTDRETRAAIREFMDGGVSAERAMAHVQGFPDAEFERAFGRPIDDTIYTDSEPHPAVHHEGCIDWCQHCVLCGSGVLYGARCHLHGGIYPDRTSQVVHPTEGEAHD